MKDRRPTRLDLARWLVCRDNPLTARVFVNRLWKLMFGQGIVHSLGRFRLARVAADASRTARLAGGRVHRQRLGRQAHAEADGHIANATGNRRSHQGAAQRDPTNVWLARQSRFRLDAELVRDNALAVSGLLSPKIGGPSVKPYQPAGYWAYLNFPKREWANDKGERPVSPRPVHLLVADLPATEPGRVRRPDARGMHRRTDALQHAAAGAGAA